MTNGSIHIAAIHVLKAKLALADADYRALLNALTAKNSTSDMTPAQRQQVRDHMQRLAERSGVAQASGNTGKAWQAKRAAASPQERKVWAIWNALKRDGKIDNASGQALNAWVKRTVQVDALGFCTGPQLDTLIEALKRWQDREVNHHGKA
ncbi:phage protein GemA/Gp16 family protein [Hydrogenophaga sp. A37]|uniref:regulatory protein GemA n=1 Tax=Hydrogenophaga sp. A37 TaxID=1945864 RepID=UPI000986E288|nr:regulatory protein GemA [Hydrogenophaga sp. A37]OOG79200.1 GemA protein [Hydrogenophaga sp. A37]